MFYRKTPTSEIIKEMVWAMLLLNTLLGPFLLWLGFKGLPKAKILQAIRASMQVKNWLKGRHLIIFLGLLSLHLNLLLWGLFFLGKTDYNVVVVLFCMFFYYYSFRYLAGTQTKLNK